MMIPEPSPAEMTRLIGAERYAIWQAVCAAIDAKYDMERTWGTAAKRWEYEYKYRRGGKTLCGLYAKDGCIGLMVIFGKEERAKFDAMRAQFPAQICREYDEATTYHDGKWVMFSLSESPDEYVKVLSVKRRPNRTV